MIQIIETQTIHRIYYAVSREKPLDNAECQALLIDNQLIELGQLYVGEQIIGVDDLSQNRFEETCKKKGFNEPKILNLDNHSVVKEEIIDVELEELPE